jgi:hypothetical protein
VAWHVDLTEQVQGDQKVFVHPKITVQKTRKKMAATEYRQFGVSVSPETGGGHFEHYL